MKCVNCGTDFQGNFCPKCGAAAPGNADVPATVKKKKKFHWWYVLIILVVIAAIGAAADNANNPSEVDDNKVEDSANDDNTNVEDNSKNEQTIFHQGDVATSSDINITLLSVTESNGSQFMKPTDGNVYVTFKFEIDNQSDKEITISSLMMFDAYFDDYAANLSIGAITLSGETQLDGSVAAGKKLAGVVGYEAPSDWKTAEIHVTPDFWFGDDIIFEYSK